MTDDKSHSDVQRWFTEAVGGIWPVATGSLSLRKGPCIRKNCPACAAGKGHSSHALYVRRGSRRFSIYVPERLVSPPKSLDYRIACGALADIQREILANSKPVGGDPAQSHERNRLNLR